MAMANAKKRAVKRFPQYKKPGKSITEQHHARACDINTIMAKYLKTGVIDHIAKWEPQFGDVSDLDFQRSMETITRVESEFYELPAFARAHYDHDPAKYLAAVVTPEGLEELQNLRPSGQEYERDGSRSLKEPKTAPETAPEAPEATGEPVT